MSQIFAAGRETVHRTRIGSGEIAESVHYEEFAGVTAVIASAAMRRLMTMARRAGRAAGPVLITGETGTGKEIVARAVHHWSPFGTRALVDVNCAALVGGETLPGLFETAAGGTLFFDEVAELDPRIQAELPRLLDCHSYLRPGGSRTTTGEVRVIATTCLEANDAVNSGKLRRDLFHRLDGFRLSTPPLRERTEDIAPLAEWFLRGTGIRIAGDALEAFEAYGWPGNVRELRNALGKAILTSQGSELRARDLPFEFFPGSSESPGDTHSLDSLEEHAVYKALERTAGHQQQAADLLGISRRTLIRRLKLYRSRGGNGRWRIGD